jgi:N-hydroxyarylamine O-acetyltransferase
MTAGDFDLDGYLARIGWAGALAADLAVLRRLVARHAAAIPFEGIEALLGSTPALDPGGLQAKLVGARRGGWCFEQNSLLALALAAIGFRARPLLARVLYGLPPGVTLSRNHLVLRVDLPEGPHMVDAGFGAVTLTGPLALRDRAPQATPHGAFRLLDTSAGLVLEALLGEAWVALYVVGADPQLPADIDAANWLVANRPGGLFTANLVAARSPPGQRITLLNHRLTLRDAAGAETVTWLDGQGLAEVLRRRFGIDLPPSDLAASEAALAARRPGHIALPG